VDSTTGKVIDNTGAVLDNTEAIKENLQASIDTAMQKAYLEAAQDKLDALVSEKMALQDSATAAEMARDKLKELFTQASDTGWTNEMIKKQGELTDEWNTAMADMEDSQRKVTSATKEWLEALNKCDTDGTKLGDTFMAQFDSILQSTEETGLKIPETLANGIRDNSISVSDAVDFTASLMSWQESVDSADLLGGQIPVALANSILANATTVSEATTEVKNLLDFADACTSAGVSGAEISANMAAGIASGQISVEAAVQAIKDGTTSQFDSMATSFSGVNDKMATSADNKQLVSNTTSTANKTASAVQTGANKMASIVSSGIAKANNTVRNAGFSGSMSTTLTAMNSTTQSMLNTNYSYFSGWVSSVQSLLNSSNFSVNATVNTSGGTKRSGYASSVYSTTEEGMEAFGIARGANFAMGAIAAPEVSMGAVVANVQASYAQSVSRIDKLARQMETLTESLGMEKIEGYLSTIANNSEKPLVMDKRVVGRLLAPEIEKANTASTALKAKLIGG
jgi:hypothetical protein